MFDHLHVKAYGQSTPLGEVAQVTIKSPTMAIINVYDTEVHAHTPAGPPLDTACQPTKHSNQSLWPLKVS